jgi:two-component system, NtrC family, sensor kinase
MTRSAASDEADPRSSVLPPPGDGAELALRARVAELEAELSARVHELAEQRRFIERIVDSLPLGLYVVDRAYRIQAWNHKRETGLQGIARKRALGRTIFDVLHRQPAALLKREFDEVFASGRMQQFQMESRATGDARTYRLSKIPMRLDDTQPRFVTHVITIGEDITDWRAALDRTAQSEKLAALGQMATGVMHEINNPLATIAACSETLGLQWADAVRDRRAQSDVAERGVPAGDPMELLRIIDLEVQRCKGIVQGLLDFARPKPLSHETLDLNAVVRQTLFVLQHHPRGKLVSVVTELESAGPLLVRGDADRLVQVLMALILNAIDASADGARVVVRSYALERGATSGAPRGAAPACAIEVVDEGHGIASDLLSRVFEPFFTTKAPGRGTGLGLSICYGLVMEHGGVLSVDSVVGQGSTFRLLLPPDGAPPITAGAGTPPLTHVPPGTVA